MKVLVPVTIDLPVGVVLYFAGLGEKTSLTPKKAMSAILTGFAECDVPALKLDDVPFVALDIKPFPHQNN